MPPAYRQHLERRLKQLWTGFERHEARKAELESEVAALYKRLRNRGEVPDRIGRLSWATMGRLVGETGPLADFDHWRELLHYAGLNIRERKSGQFAGEKKITKKGRSLLRKVVWKAVFPLLRRDRLFGPYYHRKRAGGMKSRKAQVAVMRKFLKLLYRLWRSGSRFDPTRVFACGSQHAPPQSGAD